MAQKLEELPALVVTATRSDVDLDRFWQDVYDRQAVLAPEPMAAPPGPRRAAPAPALEGEFLKAGESAGMQVLPELEVTAPPRAFNLPTEAALVDPFAIDWTKQKGYVAPAEPPAARPVVAELAEAKVVAPKPSTLVRSRLGRGVSGMDIGMSILAEHLVLPWAFEKLGLRTSPAPKKGTPGRTGAGATRPLSPTTELEELAEAKVVSTRTLTPLPALQVTAAPMLDVLEPALVTATRQSLGPAYGYSPSSRSARATRSDSRVANALQVFTRAATRTARAPATRAPPGLSAPLALSLAPGGGLAPRGATQTSTGTGGSTRAPVTTKAKECDCEKEPKKKKPKKDRKKCWKGTYTEKSRSLSKSPRVRVSCITGKELSL